MVWAQISRIQVASPNVHGSLARRKSLGLVERSLNEGLPTGESMAMSAHICAVSVVEGLPGVKHYADMIVYILVRSLTTARSVVNISEKPSISLSTTQFTLVRRITNVVFVVKILAMHRALKDMLSCTKKGRWKRFPQLQVERT